MAREIWRGTPKKTLRKGGFYLCYVGVELPVRAHFWAQFLVLCPAIRDGLSQTIGVIFIGFFTIHFVVFFNYFRKI